jgi:hypothetical protein
MNTEYLTPNAAAEYFESQGFPCGKSSLAKFRRNGGGPRWLRFGPRSVVYEKADIDVWLKARLREVAP